MENNLPVNPEGGSKKGMAKPLIIIIVLVVVVIGGFMLFNHKDSNTGSDMNMDMSATPEVTSDSSASVSPYVSTSVDQAGVKTFTVQGQNFSFSPSEIRVNKGDTVKIVFQNSGGNHDLVLDEFNVKTPVIKTGQSATVQFVADKVGTFQYYCSVGTHRQMGMQGNLIVQ